MPWKSYFGYLDRRYPQRNPIQGSTTITLGVGSIEFWCYGGSDPRHRRYLMGAEHELLPDDIIARIEYVEDEKGGEVRKFIAVKRKELGREPSTTEILSDHRYTMAKKRDDENEWELDRLERRWAQLQTLDEWVMQQVATFSDRYDRYPSARDAALGHPSQVTREEVAMVLDYLVERGYLEKFAVKPTRGPAAIRYDLSELGATVMADYLEEYYDGTVADEPDEPVESGLGEGEEVAEGAARAAVGGERSDGAASSGGEGRGGGTAGSEPLA